MGLVVLSVMEQQYDAVIAVLQDGWKITEVSHRLGSLGKPSATGSSLRERGWPAPLTDRSHRPKSRAHQVRAELEALICEIRRAHPGWESRRIEHHLKRPG